MKWGVNKNIYSWMLSLDQDSCCEKDYIEKMIPYLTVEDNLGIVAPTIIDRNIGIIGHDPHSKDYIYVNTCITSGAISNLLAWKAVGGYDESMFIDSVDFEYCYRLRKLGYKVIQVKNAQLSHEVGDSTKKRFLFWSFIVGRHSAFRKYYMARNNIYYPLKHKLYIHFIRGNFLNLKLLFTVLMYEDNKKDKVKSILKGWVDGLGLTKKYSDKMI